MSSDATKAGVKTAIELAGQAQIRDAKGRGDVIEASQLPLISTEAGAPAAAKSTATPGARGEPGRPKGSRNKRTQAWLEYLERRYTSPLIGLAETWSRPVELLARELGCTPADAFQLQQAAMIAALPYWHQKLPTPVDLTIDDASSRTENEIISRIRELAKDLGIPLGKLIDVTPNTEEKQ